MELGSIGSSFKVFELGCCVFVPLMLRWADCGADGYASCPVVGFQSAAIHSAPTNPKNPTQPNPTLFFSQVDVKGRPEERKLNERTHTRTPEPSNRSVPLLSHKQPLNAHHSKKHLNQHILPYLSSQRLPINSS
ncbi:hypothetical protein PGT21_003923 [Puccinia graminis f. sp. tritici]|uniref:Uncharacterized protein n=1 Tax=Puccinia graminis f. sp. tritici TaxID=56615 RepID=A0A5B0M2J2_PUCGR|nr:hypothetical protein PGT21_003923 [Puccinia graminis f. sp. tritici]KAA1136912.1 hypothetical protein PGTUg99_002860 [Puccinia graminis f. sp. tritici]